MPLNATAWPPRDVVSKLVESANLLLDHCDYDGDGWEQVHHARQVARDWLDKWPANWLVYMVQCQDGSLYTGVTNDLPRRLAQHNQGTGSKYCRSRRPVKLAYVLAVKSKIEAMVLESAIKRLTRRSKLKLAQSYGN